MDEGMNRASVEGFPNKFLVNVLRDMCPTKDEYFMGVRDYAYVRYWYERPAQIKTEMPLLIFF